MRINHGYIIATIRVIFDKQNVVYVLLYCDLAVIRCELYRNYRLIVTMFDKHDDGGWNRDSLALRNGHIRVGSTMEGGIVVIHSLVDMAT